MFIRWPSYDFSERIARLENCHFVRPLINSRRPLCRNWSCHFTPPIFMIAESGVRIMLSLGREGPILGSSTCSAAPLIFQIMREVQDTAPKTVERDANKCATAAHKLCDRLLFSAPKTSAARYSPYVKQPPIRQRQCRIHTAAVDAKDRSVWLW